MKLVVLIFCLLTQPDSIQIYNQTETIVNLIKTNKDVVEFFKNDVRDTLSIRYKVSNQIEYLDPQWFIKEILFERTGIEYETQSEEFHSEQLKMLNMQNDFKPYTINKLSTLSDDNSFDLMIKVFPYGANIVIIEITPHNSQIGYTHGINFIFFINENNSIKTYSFKKWAN